MLAWVWAGFIVLVCVLLTADFLVLNRRARIVRPGRALGWSVVWITVAVAFAYAVYELYERRILGEGVINGVRVRGSDAALQYLTGYLLEQSLSLENMLVIGLIFSRFHVPRKFQDRVLFWGIACSAVFRGILIAAGWWALEAWSWALYAFGALLMVSALRMLVMRDEGFDPEKTLAVRLLTRFFPVSPELDGERLSVRRDGRLMLTPLAPVLAAVVVADLSLCMDSIPALFAVTRDPFLVFASSVFGVMCLRSIYFAFAASMGRFKFVKASLVFVLVFVAVKVFVRERYAFPPGITLAVVAATLAVGVIASIVADRTKGNRPEPPLGEDAAWLARLTLRQINKVAALIIGTAVLVLGLLMTVGPGPGLVVMAVGLGILATEFVWARILLGRFERYAVQLGQRADRVLLSKPRPWLIPPVVLAFSAAVLAGMRYLPLPPQVVLISSVPGLIGLFVWVYLTMKRYNRARAWNTNIANSPTGALPPPSPPHPTSAGTNSAPSAPPRAQPPLQ